MSWVADNWHVVGGFAAGLIAWGKTTSDVSRSKKDVAEVQEALKVVGPMKEAIARIETHHEYTRAGIDDIRKELKDLREARRDSLQDR